MPNYRITPNSQRMPIEVVGSSVFGRYEKISVQRTINMFVSDLWLVSFAGYKRVLELFSTGEGRGIFNSVRGNFILAVINNTVFTIDSDLVVTTIDTMATSSGEVYIDENLSNQICIVDGINAYIYNHSLAPALTVQSFPSDLVPKYVCYHNTFFLFGNALTNNDGSKWFAYSFASNTTIAETTEFALQTKPDHALAVRRIPGQGNNVIVFGNSVCEIWTQVGGIQNYRRNSTINIDYGCISVATIAASDEFVAWLGINENNSPVIMVYSNEGFKPISTDGIDYAMQEITRPDESTALIYRQDGHLFYQLTFFNANDNITFIYDFNTQKFYDLADWQLNYHPAREMVYFNRHWYFVSINNGSLYESSTNITVNDENLVSAISPTYDPSLAHEMQRIRICNTVRADDSSRFIVNSFVFTIEQGNDPDYKGFTSIDYIVMENDVEDIIITETGSPLIMQESASSEDAVYTPRVDCSVSRDGGHTWSNTVSRNMHQQAYRRNIMNWENMGQANDFTIKLRFWGKSRFNVNNGYVDIY